MHAPLQVLRYSPAASPITLLVISPTGPTAHRFLAMERSACRKWRRGPLVPDIECQPIGELWAIGFDKQAGKERKRGWKGAVGEE